MTPETLVCCSGPAAVCCSGPAAAGQVLFAFKYGMQPCPICVPAIPSMAITPASIIIPKLGLCTGGAHTFMLGFQLHFSGGGSPCCVKPNAGPSRTRPHYVLVGAPSVHRFADMAGFSSRPAPPHTHINTDSHQQQACPLPPPGSNSQELPLVHQI